MRASYVEIYNEQVRDLLKAGSGHSDKHSIVHTPQGVTEVSGVSASPSRAWRRRRARSKRRQRARRRGDADERAVEPIAHHLHALHHRRTRRLRVDASGCLNLVDLAGSERVGRSGAEGARLKEACAINKSPLVPRRRVPGAVQQAVARAVPQQ